MVRKRAGLRVASFMGDRVSVLPDLLLARGADLSVAAPLIERLSSAGSDVVDFHGLPVGSRIASVLGSRLEVIQRVESPVLSLEPDWDTVYKAKTNAKKRNHHKRRRRQLSELGELTVTVARELPELEPALEEAFRLHALRWEGRPDGSGFGTPVGMEFHRAALKRLAVIDVAAHRDAAARRPRDRLSLLVRARGLHVRPPARLRPRAGALVARAREHARRIQSAADEGMTRVEYLGGGERYKLELSDGLSPLYHGFGLSSGVRGRATPPPTSRRSRRGCGSSGRRACTASTSRTWRPRDGSLQRGSTLAAALPPRGRAEAAAVDEARDRPEAALGREADEQQVRVARAEVTIEHGPALAHRDGVPDRGGEEASRSSPKRKPAETTTAAASRACRR